MPGGIEQVAGRPAAAPAGAGSAAGVTAGVELGPAADGVCAFAIEAPRRIVVAAAHNAQARRSVEPSIMMLV